MALQQIANTDIQLSQSFPISIVNSGANSLQLQTGNTDRLVINSSGNIGVGVTPSAWSTGKSLDVTSGPALWGYTNQTYLTNNAFYNSGWTYKASTYASAYVQSNAGQHIWYTAPSGTEGAALTFTQAMTLDASGRFMVGTTTPSDARVRIQPSVNDVYSLAINNTNWTGRTAGAYTAQYINAVPGYTEAIDVTGIHLAVGAISSYYTGNNVVTGAKITITPAYNAQDCYGVYSKLTAGSYNYSKYWTAGYFEVPNRDLQVSYGIDVIAGDGTDLAKNVAARFRGRVGLGIASPNEMLEVVGNIHLSGGDRTIFNRSNNYLAFGTNNTERMRIDSSGNVGIGTSSPRGKLDVDNIYIGTASSTHGFIRSADGVTIDTDYDNSGGDGYFAVTNSGTTRLHITDAGNVGIGTSTPTSTSKLHVLGSNQTPLYSGQIFVATSDAADIDVGGQLSFGGMFDATQSTQWAAIAGRKSTTTSGEFGGYLQLSTRPVGGNTTERVRISSNGYFAHYGPDSSWYSNATANNTRLDIIPVNGGVTYRAYSSGTDGTPAHIWNIQGTERMRIDSSGNVGIGTSSPGFKLTVVPSTTGDIAITASTGSFYSNNTGKNNYLLNSVGSYYGTVQNDSSNVWSLGYSASATVTGTPVLTWNGSGNVGIGASSPLSRLHVHGSSNTYAGSGILLGYSGVSSGYIWSTDNIYVKPNSTQNTVSGHFSIQNFSQATMIQMYSGTGSIGIGGASAAMTGTGITFPATQSASSDANTLDDYEEGTWTVTDVSGAGLAIANSNTARYVKIGKLCFVSMYISYPSTASGASSGVSLPFTADGGYSYLTGRLQANLGSGFVAQINANNAWCQFQSSANSGSVYTNSQLSTSYILVSGCYTTT